MVRVLTGCPEQPLPAEGAAPAPKADDPAPAPKASPTPDAPAAPAGGENDPRFDSCKAAIAAGYGPYVEGQHPRVWLVPRRRRRRDRLRVVASTTNMVSITPRSHRVPWHRSAQDPARGCSERRGLATHYDKLATVYPGGAILAAVLVWLRTPARDSFTPTGAVWHSRGRSRSCRLGATPDSPQSSI